MKTVELLEAVDEAGRVVLRSPGVGYHVAAPAEGATLSPGDVAGALEILGVRVRLVVPAKVRGRVVVGPPARRTPVGFGDPVLVLEALAVADEEATGQEAEDATGQEFRVASAGRIYAAPSPEEPPFITPGSEVMPGQPVALLEVMKTFSRVAFEGPGRVRVTEIVAADESDVSAGDVLFRWEYL